jgi:hypothetical protein
MSSACRTNEYPTRSEVDPLLPEQFAAARSGLCDVHGDLLRIHCPDEPANLPVVEPDRLARPDIPEDLRERDANACRRQHASVHVEDRRLPQARVGRQQQRVALLEDQGLLDWGYVHDASRHRIRRLAEPQTCFACHVAGPIEFGDDKGPVAGAHDQASRSPTCVVEVDRTAARHHVGQIAIEGQNRIHRDADGPCLRHRDEGDHRRFRDVTPGIAPRSDLENRRSRRNGTGPKFGSGEIHADLAVSLHFALRLLEAIEYSLPCRRTIVRAIDPQAIHPGRQEISHESVIAFGFRWHRDHDPDGSVPGRWTEQGVGVGGQQRFTRLEREPLGVERSLPLGTVEGVQHVKYGLHAFSHMRFRSAERREPLRGEQQLRGPKIVAAQRQVMHQIERAGPLCLGNRLKIRCAGLVRLENALADQLKITNEWCKLRRHAYS